MCTSILQVEFIFVLLTGIGTTLVSMFTPGWRNLHVVKVLELRKDFTDLNTSSFNIFKHVCVEKYSTFSSRYENAVDCNQWWREKRTWEKMVIGGMLLALLAEIAAFLWSFILIYMCCCKSCLAPPLPIFCGIASFGLLTALIIYGFVNKDQIVSIPNSTVELTAQGDVGYSFWVAVLALISMLTDTIIGAILVSTTKVLPF